VCDKHYTIKQIIEEKTLGGIVRLLCGEPVPVLSKVPEGGREPKRPKKSTTGSSPNGKSRVSIGREGVVPQPSNAVVARGGDGSGDGAGGNIGVAGSSKWQYPVKLTERIVYRLEPFPVDFPNIVASKAGENGSNFSHSNRKILVVPLTHTIQQNKEFLLGKMGERAAGDQGIPSYSRNDWSLQLFVGPPSGARRELQGPDASVSICDSLRDALRSLGMHAEANRKVGESGEPGKIIPLGTLWVKVNKKAAPGK